MTARHGEGEGDSLKLLYRSPGTGSLGEPVDDPLAIYDDVSWGPAPDHRPYVVINMVSTVDGNITLDHNRYREPIGSDVDRGLMVRLRGGADAVLRGAETVRAYPYYPKAAPESAAARQAAGRPPHPRAVVVTASCRLPLDSSYFQGAPQRPLVFTSPAADPARREAAAQLADIELLEPAGGQAPGEPVASKAPSEGAEPEARGAGAGPQAPEVGGVDWHEVLARLRTKYGVERLLVEGGPRVNYDLFALDVVDELFCTIAPKIAGQRDDLTMVEGPRLLVPLPRLRLMTVYAHEDELFLRYRVAVRFAGAATLRRKGSN